jgi:glycosyltransferase involved in cell wall biosynthesis
MTVADGVVTTAREARVREFGKGVRDRVPPLRWPTPIPTPAWTVAGLAALGLIIHRVWLTDTALSSNDWTWVSPKEIALWFPWPTVWQPQAFFGIKYFQLAFQFPIDAVAGLLGTVGASWALSEKVLYFVPFAVLSLLSPWILAREILGRTKWAIASALIYATNTYFLIFIAVLGQVALGVAEVLAPLVLVAFMRTIRGLSLRWALLAGLVFSLQAAYEIRIAYLTGILCALYFCFAVAVEPGVRKTASRLGLSILVFAILCLSQAYWWVPLLAYRGNPGLPVAASPWVAFMGLTHGITGISPYWTGGPPAIFTVTTINPAFLIFPLVAFTSLLVRRWRIEILWLCLVALIAAFLIKQTNPPAGEVYTWMFHHVPGWSLFREASKLYFIVALAYAILVPFVLKELFQLRLNIPHLRIAPRILGLAGLISVGALILSFLVPLETGQLGGTVRPQGEPQSFAALTRILDQDKTYGAVVWLGSAWVTGLPDPYRNSYFGPRSLLHPLVEVNGILANPDLLSFGNDPLEAFCRVPQVPFCYVNSELFPYLLQRMGVKYVVAPAGARVGTLPDGLSYEVFQSRVASILGSPELLQAGDTGLAVWRLGGVASPVSQASAIAIVDGPPSVTADVLPALEALNLPVSYRPTTPTNSSDPTASIRVYSPTPSGYIVNAGADLVCAAASMDPALKVLEGGRSLTLTQMRFQSTPPGWRFFGPIHLEPGHHLLRAANGIQLGPCIAWTPTTQSVLNSEPDSAADPGTSLQAERVDVSTNLTSPSWLELRRSYDSGWQLSSGTAHIVGDAIFNLYYSKPAGGARFTFSTGPWEGLGRLISLAALVAVGLALLRTASPSRAPASSHLDFYSPPRWLIRRAREAAIAGLALLTIAALLQAIAWFTVSSSFPWVNRPVALFDTVPYSVSESYITIAMVLFGISIGVSLIGLAIGGIRLNRSSKSSPVVAEMKKRHGSKSVVLATHYWKTGAAMALREYLVPRASRFLFVGIPLFAGPDLPYCEIFAEGSMIERSQTHKWPRPLRFVGDVLEVVRCVSRQGDRFEVFVAADSLLAVAGLYLRWRGRVSSVILYTVDFVPRRFHNGLANRIYHAVDAFAVNRVDLVWNVSDQIVKAREQREGHPLQSRQMIVPHGASFGRIRRRTLDESDRFRVVFLGHLTEKQGLQLVIEAFPAIVSRVPAAKLTVIGDGPYIGQLKEMSQRLGVTDAVEFTGVIEDHHEVESRIAACALAVATYVPDPLSFTKFADPGKIRTYLACGLPVVLTAVPPIAAMVESRGAGRIIGYDVGEAARVVGDYLEDTQMLEQGRAAATALGSEFDWDRIFDDAWAATRPQLDEIAKRPARQSVAKSLES